MVYMCMVSEHCWSLLFKMCCGLLWQHNIGITFFSFNRIHSYTTSKWGRSYVVHYIGSGFKHSQSLGNVFSNNNSPQHLFLLFFQVLNQTLCGATVAFLFIAALSVLGWFQHNRYLCCNNNNRNLTNPAAMKGNVSASVFNKQSVINGNKIILSILKFIVNSKVNLVLTEQTLKKINKTAVVNI